MHDGTAEPGGVRRRRRRLAGGVNLRRAGFDAILGEAVHSVFLPELYGERAAWQQAVERSSVRLQWDPDHDPCGGNEARRAIQLGLSGEVLRRYAHEWIVCIEDVTELVRAQHAYVLAHRLEELLTPVEDVYPVPSPETARRLQLA